MDNSSELSERLSAVLEEIKDIMNARKARVEELRDQITMLENDNYDLEKKINELIQDTL